MTYPKRIEEIFQIIGEKYANCESSLRVYFDEQEEKLAEAVGLLRKIADWPNGGSQYGQENIKNAAKLFLARHVQAEQQKAKPLEPGVKPTKEQARVSNKVKEDL